MWALTSPFNPAYSLLFVSSAALAAAALCRWHGFMRRVLWGTETIIGISNDFSPWWTSLSCSDTTSLLPPYLCNVACNIFFLSYSLLSTLPIHSLCTHRHRGARGCHLTNVGGKSLWKRAKSWDDSVGLWVIFATLCMPQWNDFRRLIHDYFTRICLLIKWNCFKIFFFYGEMKKWWTIWQNISHFYIVKVHSGYAYWSLVVYIL